MRAPRWLPTRPASLAIGIVCAHVLLGGVATERIVRGAQAGDYRMCDGLPSFADLQSALAGQQEALFCCDAAKLAKSARVCSQYELLPVLLHRVRVLHQVVRKLDPGERAVLYAGDEETLDSWIAELTTLAGVAPSSIRPGNGVALVWFSPERDRI